MPDAAVGAIAFVTLLTIMVGARGIRVARTPDDFMVAARQVPPALNAAAISGEYLSAASFLGIAGLVVSQGLGALWYSVGYTAGYLVLLLLVAAPLRRFGAYTIPDFAVGRLGSRGLRQTATALVLVIGWFYLLPQMKGAGITLQWVLGTPYWVGAATLGVVVSCNIAMGGMKGITFVQCFQYWLKLCAIGIPAIALLIAWHTSNSNLTPDRATAFTRATVVAVPQATSFTLTHSARATVTGLVDQRAYRDQSVGLSAGRHVAGAGARIGFAAGAPVPVSLAMAPASSESWDSPFLTSSTSGAHPLAATYGVIIATFFGAIGLPHILVRFYTNPDGEAARRTTLIVVLLLSSFYLFPTVLAVLTRLHAPQLYLSSDSDSVVLALPGQLLPGLPGELLAALVAAGAFAAFLSTSSGLLVSVAGALSHDFMKRGVTTFRWCAITAGAVATIAALLIDRFSLALLVGWAFAIAASSFCPLMVLGIWWRRLTRIGATAGILIGGGSCLTAIVSTMLGAAASGWGAVLLGQPAIWTVPLSFGVMIGASLLTQRTVPANVGQVMLRMHLPEALSRQAYRRRPALPRSRYPSRGWSCLTALRTRQRAIPPSPPSGTRRPAGRGRHALTSQSLGPHQRRPRSQRGRTTGRAGTDRPASGGLRVSAIKWVGGGRNMADLDYGDGPRRRLLAAGAAALLGSFIALLAPAAPAASASPAGPSLSTAVACTSTSHPAVAAALARDIQAARRGRSSTVAVWVDAPGTGVTCSLSGSSHFDSASIVKVTILGATLRKALDQHRHLTSNETALLRAMITTSSNSAASTLWARLGRSYLQHFLNLAGMRQTVLGPGGYWGLTQVTAHDEMLLLRLLLTSNAVLSSSSRAYALSLMSQVISSQRWGVPAGAPRTVTVHVKNGWLPRATHGWRINSIGGFTSAKGWYSIVVLSMDNPTMSYGITTVEAIARVIHRDLNPAVPAAIPLSKPSPAWGTPDEQIPATVPAPL